MKFKNLVLPLILGLALTLAVGMIASWATPQATPRSINTGQHFLPPYGNPRERFGFDSGGLSGYDVTQLHAGWYSNWGANLNPPHPDKLVYAQLIRFHAGSDPRDPDQVKVYPNRETIAQIAANHPGSLWMLSNEPDSVYQGDPILPATYAHVYHEFYHYIKDLDPTAIIANGGIVQPTPCRLEYLDIVLDTYEAAYGELMPVDVWNIHAFVLREVYNSWGASTPPGVDPSCAMAYTVDDSGNINIFWENIRAMRSWMKERGYQDRPLVISEYGILWPQWFAPEYTPQRVSQFMAQTFDLFLYDPDPDIGYPADDYRLVQAWAWYSLSDDSQYNGYLFYSSNKQISPMGEAYADYTAALSGTLYADLNARLVAAWPDSSSYFGGDGTIEPLTFTVVLTGNIGNLGKQPVTDVLARLEIISEGGTALFGRDAAYDVPARFDGVVVLPPMTATLAALGRHYLRLSLDPEQQIVEPREWNNVVTTTLDIRPDLVPLALTYRLSGSIVQSGTLFVTATVANQGNSPSPAVSATVDLGTVPESTLRIPRTFSVPSLPVDEQASLEISLTWPLPEHDLYRLALTVDETEQVVEQQEENNTLETLIPIVLRATLRPTTTTILTNTSGSLQLRFPQGLVTTTTEVLYTPFWPANWIEGGLNWSTTAFSLTTLRDGRPASLAITRPFSVTWRYSEVELNGLDEERMRLFAWQNGGYWREAGCRSYQRDPAQNRLTVVPCRVARFVFGESYKVYLPLAVKPASTRNLHIEPSLMVPEADYDYDPGRPRSPLRLP